MKHLESNNILSDYDYQCGFRHSRSCEALLIMLLHDIYSAAMMLELYRYYLHTLCKSIFTVPHQRLLYKLEWYSMALGAI